MGLKPVWQSRDKILLLLQRTPSTRLLEGSLIMFAFKLKFCTIMMEVCQVLTKVIPVRLLVTLVCMSI